MVPILRMEFRHSANRSLNKRAVGPLLSKYADYGDENLHLADEVVNELVDRQLFRLWQPRRYDGLEVDVLTQMVVTSELATPCAIACWSC